MHRPGGDAVGQPAGQHRPNPFVRCRRNQHAHAAGHDQKPPRNIALEHFVGISHLEQHCDNAAGDGQELDVAIVCQPVGQIAGEQHLGDGHQNNQRQNNQQQRERALLFRSERLRLFHFDLQRAAVPAFELVAAPEEIEQRKGNQEYYDHGGADAQPRVIGELRIERLLQDAAEQNSIRAPGQQ